VDALSWLLNILPINTHIFSKGLSAFCRTEILGFRVSVLGLGGWVKLKDISFIR
jgi:hypothetical protein